MPLEISAVALLVVILVATNYFYNSGELNKNYSDGKSEKIPQDKWATGVVLYSRYVTFVFTILSIFFSHALLLEFYEFGMLSFSIGSLFLAFGTLTFIGAKIQLGRSYSPCNDSYVPQSVVTSGIYKYIRHPIYTGNLLLLLGATIMSGSFIVASTLILLFPLYQKTAKREEKALAASFDEYAAYLGKSGRFFPRVINSK